MEENIAVPSQEQTSRAVVAFVYGNSVFAHDVLIKLVGVR